MTGQRRTTILIATDDQDSRPRYADALLAAGYMVHAVASPDEAEPTARMTKFDIAIIDSALDERGLAVAERLAALRRRPRLVALTTRHKTSAPLEWLFDVYLVKPCPPWDLVDAVRSVQLTPEEPRDLFIIARDRVDIGDILHRFGGLPAGVDFRLDLRRGERRRPQRIRTSRDPVVERRRGERRVVDIYAQLRAEGFAFVRASRRT